MMNTTNPVEIFATEDGRTELQVHLQQDTVWLSLNQMTALFDRDKSVISRHISNVFKEGELASKKFSCCKFCNNCLGW